MTVAQYCEYLGWSIQQLSRMASIDYKSASKAYHGNPVSGNVKQRIAQAFSTAMGQKIQVGEITW